MPATTFPLFTLLRQSFPCLLSLPTPFPHLPASLILFLVSPTSLSPFPSSSPSSPPHSPTPCFCIIPIPASAPLPQPLPRLPVTLTASPATTLPLPQPLPHPASLSASHASLPAQTRPPRGNKARTSLAINSTGALRHSPRCSGRNRTESFLTAPPLPNTHHCTTQHQGRRSVFSRAPPSGFVWLVSSSMRR